MNVMINSLNVSNISFFFSNQSNSKAILNMSIVLHSLNFHYMAHLRHYYLLLRNPINLDILTPWQHSTATPVNSFIMISIFKESDKFEYVRNHIEANFKI